MTGDWHTILTPSERAGAVAMILVHLASPRDTGLPSIAPHQLRRADLLGIDDGVVLGVDDRTLMLMPHGGVAIVRRISARLQELGIPLRAEIDPALIYPEASTEIEAWCLHALSIAPSPVAVDVLLNENARWSSLGVASIDDAAEIGRACAELDRLIHPPTVVAVGRANVGKSSLLNALVGQRVALVADVAGTTRDHVGLAVDLGGLVVRWIDTPGIDERIKDRDEIGIAVRVIEHADLIVHCIDSLDDNGELDPRLVAACPRGVPVVRIGTRSDLAEHRCELDARVQLGQEQRGLEDLVRVVRSTLLPENVLWSEEPWRFWASLRPEA